MTTKKKNSYINKAGINYMEIRAVKDSKGKVKYITQVSRPRVILFVDGGVVQEIYSDYKVDVAIVDYDTEGGGDVRSLRCMNGEWQDAYIHGGKICVKKKKVVDHYWKQLVKP